MGFILNSRGLIMNIKNTIVIASIIGLLCSVSLQAHMFYVAKLKDPKTGHIVRLAGDYHVGIDKTTADDIISAEQEFMSNVAEPLTNYLSNAHENREIFVVESGEMRLSDCIQETLLCKGFSYPLMNRLIALGMSGVPNSLKDKAMTYGSCNLAPCVPIIAYNMRLESKPTWEKVLDGALHDNMASPSIRQLFTASTNVIYERNQHYDEQFQQMHQKFYSVIEEKIAHADNHFLETRDAANNDDYIMEDLNFTVSDFGFFGAIGKARTIDRNITLYTGAEHSWNLEELLIDMGYEPVLRKGVSREDFNALMMQCSTIENLKKNLPPALTQQDYIDFF